LHSVLVLASLSCYPCLCLLPILICVVFHSIRTHTTRANTCTYRFANTRRAWFICGKFPVHGATC
jgi:hypothetical protein